MRIIPDDGPVSARIVAVGEMDSAQEEAQGRHFVGPAGGEWSRWLAAVGLRREEIRVTNVVPYRGHPSNKIAAVPHDEVERNIMQLHERLAALPGDGPAIIVPMGNTALRALTGKVGISKHRGSIYEYVDLKGRHIKVIPSIHPAALVYQKGAVAEAFGSSTGGNPGWKRRALYDWTRIKSDSAFRELRLPERELFIEPTWDDVCDYAESARAHADILVIDIETPKTLIMVPKTLKSGTVKWARGSGPRRMTVFGASYDPAFGIAIPTTKEYWASRGIDLPAVLSKISALCTLPFAKGGQSAAGFDRPWLHWYDINVSNYIWDTRWLHHVRDPLDDHSLAYQASICTREPFWKDDGKEDDGDSEARYDIRDYWRYNCKDTTVERELVDTHLAAMTPVQITFYLKRHAALYDAMHAISVGGIRVDETRMKRLNAKFMGQAIGIQELLTDHTRATDPAGKGFPLYGPKGSLSSKKLQTYLYTNLRLPARKNRKTGALSADEITVRRLMLTPAGKKALGTDSDDDKFKPGPLILRHRRLEVLQRFTKEGIIDEDNRARSQIGWTYTLRFTMGKSPRGTGNNNQNTDRELLGIYVPDPGHIFLETDLSQAEDRVVKVLSAACTPDKVRVTHLLERARSMPWENDEHWRAAEAIFERPRAELSKDTHRYIGKRSRHGGNYGERGQTMSDVLLKEGFTYTAEECDGFINTILDKDTPEVRTWQQWVRQVVMRDRAYTTTWGHRVDVKYEALDDNLYRKMYALEPQNSVTSIIKYWGLIPLHNEIARRGWDARIANEKHDSLLISTAPVHVYEIMCFLKAKLERERQYRGIPLTIWAEFKLGMTAAMPIEWKRFPSQDEVETTMKGMIR